MEKEYQWKHLHATRDFIVTAPTLHATVKRKGENESMVVGRAHIEKKTLTRRWDTIGGKELGPLRWIRWGVDGDVIQAMYWGG